MTQSTFSARVRGIGRGLVLSVSLFEVLLRFALLAIRFRGHVPDWERALWMHQACSKIVRRLGMTANFRGTIPSSGLIVSNHLSYLDILFFASRIPCIFISKSEVRSWPIFGILAQCGGTVFVERERRQDVSRSAARIRKVLDQQIPVILFPESTSTDGSTVLPFHSAFLEPAVAAQAVIHPAAIHYTVSGGVESDLCYYGDITFAPHLLGALRRSSVSCEIFFTGTAVPHSDRKEAARSLHEEVTKLRQGLRESVNASGTFV